MGLDIHLRTNNHDDVFQGEDIANNNWQRYSLSRTFCNLMCRVNVIGHTPELDQIGEITGLDISPLYGMESADDLDIEEQLSYCDTEEEKEEFSEAMNEAKNKVEDNIDLIDTLINQLISKLNNIHDLPKKLMKTDFDTLDPEVYFSDFSKDKGEGYINNNFGQDLRNFKRFIEHAKSKGSTNVYFTYG